MEPIDYQREYNRLSELYAKMGEGELETVAAEAYDLTDVAREALSFAISTRGFKIPLNLASPAEEEVESLPPTDDGFVPDDQDLSVNYVAQDRGELLKVKVFFDAARIECFLGEEKVHDPKELTGGFEGGVEMRVWKAEAKRAYQLLAAVIPDFEKRDPVPDVEVRCPKCHSDGVIFEERAAAPTDSTPAKNVKFCWVCDDCGHEWEDDGIVQS
jgi:DNA-directed RNA polymerase subunit M/transcription elongation factor TFIIS